MDLTALVVAAIIRKNNAAPEVQQGMFNFRLPKAFTVLGLISIVIAVTFLIGSVLILTSELPLALFLLACTIMFGIMGVILFRDSKNYSVACNENSIVVIQGHNSIETCKWSDIVSARVHPLSKNILLRTKDGRTLKVNAYLIGSDALFNMMTDKTDLPVAKLVAKARAVG